MDVSEDLHGSVNFENHRLLLEDFLGFICQCEDMLSSKCKVGLAIDRSGPLFGSQEMIQKQLMKRIDIFAPLLSFITPSKVHNLWSLSFLLLNLSSTHSDLHISFREALHGWSC